MFFYRYGLIYLTVLGTSLVKKKIPLKDIQVVDLVPTSGLIVVIYPLIRLPSPFCLYNVNVFLLLNWSLIYSNKVGLHGWSSNIIRSSETSWWLFKNGVSGGGKVEATPKDSSDRRRDESLKYCKRSSRETGFVFIRRGYEILLDVNSIWISFILTEDLVVLSSILYSSHT